MTREVECFIRDECETDDLLYGADECEDYEDDPCVCECDRCGEEILSGDDMLGVVFCGLNNSASLRLCYRCAEHCGGASTEQLITELGGECKWENAETCDEWINRKLNEYAQRRKNMTGLMTARAVQNAKKNAERRAKA